MNCCRCGRPFSLRPDAPVLRSENGRGYAWGPKCAVLAGVVKPKRRQSKPPTPGRARAFAGQLDWINNVTEEGIEA
jgi:hypothetical protein